MILDGNTLYLFFLLYKLYIYYKKYQSQSIILKCAPNEKVTSIV